MRYLCLLIVLLTGCAPTEATVAPELAPYFARFERRIGYQVSGISAQFADLALPTVGQCQPFDDGPKLIEIDPTYWAKASDDMREELIFHELGHCCLGVMEHDKRIERMGDYNCPVSIMFPSVFGNSACYLHNKAYYYQELRSHR